MSDGLWDSEAVTGVVDVCRGTVCGLCGVPLFRGDFIEGWIGGLYSLTKVLVVFRHRLHHI